MKRLILAILVITLCITTLVIPSVAAEDAVLLRMNLKPGQVYKLETATTTKTVTQMSGSKMDLTQSSTFGVAYTVDRVEADGAIDLTCTYETIRFGIKSSMMNATYDSKNPKKSDSSLAGIFGPMVGAKIQLRMAPTGQVIETKGVKELIAKMSASMAPAQKQSMEKMVAGLMNSNMLLGGLSEYPEKPVHIGDSWATQTVNDMMFPMNVRTTYMFKGSQDGSNVIDVTSEITPGPVKGGTKGSAAVSSLKGGQTGTIEVDAKTGLPVRSRLTQKINAEMTSQSNGKTVTTPTTIESTVTCQAY